MTLSKNQKIGLGVTAAALLLLLIGKSRNWFKKSEEIVTDVNANITNIDPLTGKPRVTGDKAVAADGSSLSTEDRAKEMYKTLIGTIAYIRNGKDEQSKQIRDAISEQVIASGKSQDRLFLEFATKMNKGKEGLKEAVKMIDKDVAGHVEYFIDNGKFLIEA